MSEPTRETYTPDAESVREQYSREQPPHIGTVSEKRAEFDRWLAETVRAARAEAWDESAAEACGDNWLPDWNGNPGRPNLADMKRRNPYRQGEGQ